MFNGAFGRRRGCIVQQIVPPYVACTMLISPYDFVLQSGVHVMGSCLLGEENTYLRVYEYFMNNECVGVRVCVQ